MREILKSKRTWTIVGFGILNILAALFPQKFAVVSEVVKAIVPGVA